MKFWFTLRRVNVDTPWGVAVTSTPVDLGPLLLFESQTFSHIIEGDSNTCIVEHANVPEPLPLGGAVVAVRGNGADHDVAELDGDAFTDLCNRQGVRSRSCVVTNLNVMARV
jgi:hypothetical protein